MKYFVWLLICSPLLAGDLILIGSGGDPAFDSKFSTWGTQLEQALVGLGRPKQGIVLVSAQEAASKPNMLEAIRKSLERMAATHSNKDDLYVYLIGHGSYLRGIARFHIPGPDLTAQELTTLLTKIKSRRTIVVNASSASEPFIKALSGPNRIVCSATKNGREGNATEFMAFWIESLTRQNATDQNQDDCLSVWEIAQSAARLTQKWYSDQRLYATEHALLDDNGDGAGTPLVIDEKETDQSFVPSDGQTAKKTYLWDQRFPANSPPHLVEAYLSKIAEVEKLRSEKANLSPADYWQRFETAITEAAKLNKTLRIQPK